MSKLYILLVFVLGVGLVSYFVRQPSQQITIHSEAILVNADVQLLHVTAENKSKLHPR